MFPRDRRLRTSREIVTSLRKGKRGVSRTLALSLYPRPNRPSRVAVIVDTKVSKKAVVRNLVRRRIRAILIGRSQLPSGDIVVRALPSAADATFDQLKADTEQCLRKAS